MCFVDLCEKFWYDVEKHLVGFWKLVYAMVGKNHIITNISSAVCIGATCTYILKAESADNWVRLIQKGTAIVYHAFVPQGTVFELICYFAAAMLLFIFGSLLPDVDSEKSELGRYVHLPIEHRTWTHTIWAVCLTAIPVYYAPVAIWLTLGYFLHLWWDSVSVCGICWFYPFQNYRRYPNGGKIAKPFHFKFYRAGESSEVVFAVVITLLTTGLSVYLLFFSPPWT